MGKTTKIGEILLRIITVNLPESYLKAIDSLTNKPERLGLYPSRSELIRVAVREFLIKELEAAKQFEKYQVYIREKEDLEKFKPIEKQNEPEIIDIPGYRKIRVIKRCS